MADVNFFLQVLITFGVLFWTWRLICWAWLKPMRLQEHLRKQGFNGNPYKLLYGDTEEIWRSFVEAKSRPIELSHVIMPRVLPFLHQTVKKYGKMCIQWYGPTPRVNIMEPKLIKEIMTTHYSDVIKPEVNPFVKLFVTGLALYEGKKWVKHRKIINTAFNMEKLKMMLPAFQASCCELISKWGNCLSSDSCELDVWPDLQSLTGDAISRTAFGTNYEEAHKVFALQSEQAAHFVQTAQTLYIPGFRFLPTKRNRRMKAIDREVRVILRGIITKREKFMRNGETNNTDLLGMLMESNFEAVKGRESSSNDDTKMTLDDIIEECKLFYFAGQETSSTHILWTIILLCIHQEWQQKAREEVLQVFGKRKPDYAGLTNLKIVPMILNEVLRLYPPVASLTRVTQTEIKIGELNIPPGVEIELPILMMHHDRDLWGEDADEFNPGRFSKGVSKATSNQLSFFPFGWGPRICAGQQFAMLEVKLAVSMILQAFSFELSPNYAHAPHSIITVQPQYGAPIILHKL